MSIEHFFPWKHSHSHEHIQQEVSKATGNFVCEQSYKKEQ